LDSLQGKRNKNQGQSESRSRAKHKASEEKARRITEGAKSRCERGEGCTTPIEKALARKVENTEISESLPGGLRALICREGAGTGGQEERSVSFFKEGGGLACSEKSGMIIPKSDIRMGGAQQGLEKAVILGGGS